jgi:hypothetical protein
MRMFKCDTNPVNHLQSPHCPRERGNSIRERELNVPLLALWTGRASQAESDDLRPI